MSLEAEREAVAAASRRLAADGLVRGTSGNVSLAAGERVAVTPTGAQLADLQPGQVAVVDLDGTQVDGPLAPTSELGLHLDLLRERGGGSVVHTHAPVATALACVLDELPAIHYEMLALGGPVRVAPYATFGTAELAANVRRALEGRSAALLANHGTVAHAGDLEGALRATELLEWAATLYWRAAAIGTPRALEAADLEAVAAAIAQRGYGRTQEVSR